MDNIRPLTQQEIEQSLDLSSFAFQMEMDAQEREERTATMVPEQTLGYFVNQLLAAKLTIIPLRIFIQGKSIKMGGIAGVASWPEFRRGGLVRIFAGVQLTL